MRQLQEREINTVSGGTVTSYRPDNSTAIRDFYDRYDRENNPAYHIPPEPA